MSKPKSGTIKRRNEHGPIGCAQERMFEDSIVANPLRHYETGNQAFSMCLRFLTIRVPWDTSFVRLLYPTWVKAADHPISCNTSGSTLPGDEKLNGYLSSFSSLLHRPVLDRQRI